MIAPRDFNPDSAVEEPEDEDYFAEAMERHFKPLRSKMVGSIVKELVQSARGDQDALLAKTQEAFTSKLDAALAGIRTEIVEKLTSQLQQDFSTKHDGLAQRLSAFEEASRTNHNGVIDRLEGLASFVTKPKEESAPKENPFTAPASVPENPLAADLKGEIASLKAQLAEMAAKPANPPERRPKVKSFKHHRDDFGRLVSSEPVYDEGEEPAP